MLCKRNFTTHFILFYFIFFEEYTLIIVSDKSEYQYKIKETLYSNASIKQDGQNYRLSRNRKLNSIRNFHPFMKRKSICHGKHNILIAQ